MDEDVTKLTDEELDKKLEEAVVATPAPEEAPAEPSQEEDVEDAEVSDTVEEVKEEPEEEPEAEQPKEEEQKPPSRRETLRIQQLLKKYKDTSQTPQQPPIQNQLDYNQALDADPEVIKQLETDRQATSQQSYNLGLEQAKAIQFHTRLEIDAPRVESKYEFLDKSSNNFDPVRASALNELYLNQVGYSPGDPQRGIPETVANPNIRYSDFVEAQMEFAEALMRERNTRTVSNVAKQAAQTGLRPDGSSAKALNLNKPPSQMSDEELDAFLKKAGYGTNK